MILKNMTSELENKIERFNQDLEQAKDYFLKHLGEFDSITRVYTHIDADGLSAGSIIGKALYRENLPFQINILRQLEREEIIKIANNEYNGFMIFCDFGSGQYLDLQKELLLKGYKGHFIILDHHLPQNIGNKQEVDKIEDIHIETSPWHINPYFYGVDGSTGISGSSICYFFAKCLNDKNIDLSPIAVVGSIGDIQNQGPNKSFSGLNSLVIEDAKKAGLIEIVDDLNFSTIKPLNEAIAYSSDIKLPGLTGETNKALKFLQTLGILMENPDGSVKTLNDMNKDDKQKISSAIIEYATLKLNIEPVEIIKKLIVNRYLLVDEVDSELRDADEFSNLLNACGRTDNGSLGIAIAMGDRNKALLQSKDVLLNYKKSLLRALSWISEEDKIQQKAHVQFFFGEEVIPENIIGTVSSMLVFDKRDIIDKNKPIFGCALREEQGVYKISGRASKKLVNKGLNLSEVIREALELSNLDALGGGHPPAAGTKVPVDKIEVFLENCNSVVKKQLE
ncbi:MAG: DHH family phosphoesterase [Promethearchaeota archaeon]|nr:MAG: DHH family phosphoesterase [Candidatus Lokiarchaeota archaeon]